jgi:hypothetical protein
MSKTDLTKRRWKSCVEEWPECETGAYDPHCCRFPKSCSPHPYQEAIDAGNVTEADLEPAPDPAPTPVLMSETRDVVAEVAEYLGDWRRTCRQMGIPYTDDDAAKFLHAAGLLADPALTAEHASMYEALQECGEQVVALTAEVERLRAQVIAWESDFSCDEGCGEHPDQCCSRHGLKPQQLWDRSDALTKRAEKAEGQVARIEAALMQGGQNDRIRWLNAVNTLTGPTEGGASE